MKIKFKGVITTLSATDFKSNGVMIGIQVYDKMEQKDIDNLYKFMNQYGTNITMTSKKKEEKPKQAIKEYNILYFKSLTNLIMDTKTMLEENWECLGAPFWNNNFIYQAFTRRKEK